MTRRSALRHQTAWVLPVHGICHARFAVSAACHSMTDRGTQPWVYCWSLHVGGICVGSYSYGCRGLV